MEILDSKTNEELLKSILGEVAKATNELKCARTDLEKAQNRLSFAIMLTNELINRKE